METQKNLVAACPKCGARYRVDAERLSPEGGRLRCSRCKAVFRVRPPAVAVPGVLALPVDAPPASRWGGRVVVLADSDIAAGKATAEALADWDFEPVLVHDGVEAILTIQRLLPAVAVLHASLPKMFGFQVCELMKRNESLQRIHVVLVGAIHHQDRNRCGPDEMYGADAYVERPQLPEALRPILRGFGIEVGGALRPSVAAPPLPEAPPPQPAPALVEKRPLPAPPATDAPREPAEPPEVDEAAVAEAERLARIIVSDIVLYNADKFEAGVGAGDVLDVLADELEVGRSLLAQRVDAGVRDLQDYLSEELFRVAKSRGMGG